MIQRKQTVFLLLSIITTIICMFMQIGTFEAEKLGVPSQRIFNICIVENGGQSINYVVAGLFASLAGAAILSGINIFGYKNRNKQSRQCLMTIALLLAWIGVYAVLSNVLCPEGYTFNVSTPACLPIISIIFQWLARRGIIADEKLIRSVDRIR